jgi:hypothetical protein
LRNDNCGGCIVFVGFGCYSCNGYHEWNRRKPSGSAASWWYLPDLPAYYIRMFAPGVPFDDSVGGTAFCHGSDNLAFTAKYCRDEDENSRVFPFLVRPSLLVCPTHRNRLKEPCCTQTQRMLGFTIQSIGMIDDPYSNLMHETLDISIDIQYPVTINFVYTWLMQTYWRLPHRHDAIAKVRTCLTRPP